MPARASKQREHGQVNLMEWRQRCSGLLAGHLHSLDEVAGSGKAIPLCFHVNRAVSATLKSIRKDWALNCFILSFLMCITEF